MHMQKVLGLALLAGLSAQAQQVNVRGKISDGTGKAVANAIVEIAKLKLKDTTGADGAFAITGTGTALRGTARPFSGAVSFSRGVLDFSLVQPALVKVEIFDTKGNMAHREVHRNSSAGSYRLDLRGNLPLNQLSIVRASYGDEAQTFQYMPSSYETVAGTAIQVSAPAGARLAKVAATVDTLKVTASGSAAMNIALSSYDTTVNVTMGAAGDRWGGLKNAPIKSAGCGKALGTISKSGTYTISSSGGRGTYIIDIPTGYDKDTPYRLIFGNHCMGGTAARVAEAEKGSAGDDLSGFYSIKTMATKDNIQAIYVAMQGNSDGTWTLPNDSKFWNDVLTLVENNLCVDTTRVFVTGFSFGAMFSYVLSLEYPEKIRAVATYAPANYNMTQPNNRHIPIAYYQTTGTTDGTCPWVNNDAQKKGGKYCLLQHMEDNGCTSTASDIKLATGSTHVSTEFTGCKEGYPVKFGSFQGGHQAVHTDPGTNFSWIEKEAWEFFKRF
jgi:poly(3-hydroxybutyrate) depolymerase